MDLDDELRKLFTDDDRLDVHVSPDTADRVIRGADRRRQRRTAVTGAFAVVALVGAGLGIVQLRQIQTPDDVAGSLLPTATSTSTTPPSISTHTQTVTVTVDPPTSASGNGNGTNPNNGNGNTGNPTKPKTTTPPPTPESQPGVYGKLKLGMSEADALATGSLVEPSSPEGNCKGYATQSVPDSNAVIISPVKGIARITLPSFAKTPKNIGAGSKVSDVKTAYPSATQSGSDLVVQMNATPRWTYVFENDGTTVTTVRMRLADNDCPAA